ncbi:glycosyltransferase family 2 protein [Coleofasciculus chthonoplastes]|uniref:glycosyltransferase family 2 protein n=1 Tax=Coleofasciculus chthonoplastes TaxID=64178 RepID=UPI0033003D04
MDSAIKFSVIIPTRQRPDTLEHCLKTVTAQKYHNLDIIVSDNFSEDHTDKLIRSYQQKDSRIKYLNTGKRVSMSHNWEFALSHVKDGWVTIIGDDDALLPSAISRVSSIIQNNNNVYAVQSSLCKYSWPSLNSNRNSYFTVPIKKGYEIRDCKKWLLKVMNGTASYDQLPMLYQGGFVSMDIINKLKKEDAKGIFYKSMIPDVYSAIALALFLDKYLYLYEPLAINGASHHSTGTSHFKNKNTYNSPVQKFYSEGNIPIHKSLQLECTKKFTESLQVMVYESYLQATFLHYRKNLKINMNKQLNLALISAKDQHYDEVEKWVNLILEKHGIKLNFLQSNTLQMLRIFYKTKQILFVINTFFNTRGINLFDMELSNVYEASIVAKTIWMSENKYGYSRIRKILYKTKSLFAKNYNTLSNKSK